jgi:spermidine synthase
MDELRTLARGVGAHGETVLRERRRPDGGLVHELVVNGVFAMDSTETASEQELAGFAAGARGAVLVGGLGLGYTAAAVLDQHPGPARVDVVELDPHLVGWARRGVTPLLARVAADARTRLHVGNVAAVLTGSGTATGPWDAILLDVDNGPDFLIHADNAVLYEDATLAAALAALVPGGVLALWCQGPAPALLERLQHLDGTAREHRYAVEREGRRFCYVVLTLERPGATGPGPGEPAARPRPECAHG